MQQRRPASGLAAAGPPRYSMRQRRQGADRGTRPDVVLPIGDAMSTHGADVRSLVEQQRPGWSLAQPFYVEPAIFEHERRRLLARQWRLMGHPSGLPRIG